MSAARSSNAARAAESNAPAHNTLQQDYLSTILSFVSLDDLLESVRPVCRFLKEACDDDPRWLPLIAPPSLQEEVLTLKTHGEPLRRYYLHYKRWLSNPETFSQRTSALSGFFSLAPWRKIILSDDMVYPTPWLHRMVYGQTCPTTSTDDDKDDRSFLLAFSRPQKRLKHEDGDRRKSQDTNHSTFYQRRVRSNPEEIFRTFHTEPIDPERQEYEEYETCPAAICGRRRVIIQPVNLRKIDGSKHPSLPDHNIGVLKKWNDACFKILECYFGNSANDRVVVKDCIKHRVDLRMNRGYCRRNREDYESVQVDARALECLSDRGIVDDNVNAEDNGDREQITVNVIAPDMYADNLTFAFDCELGLHYHRSRVLLSARVLAIFHIDRWINNPKKHVQLYATLVLQNVLKQMDAFNVCENFCCALNNADSVDEAANDCHLILCPACIRKLQLNGILYRVDIPTFLGRLYQILSQEPFVETCQEDLRVLRENYGIVPSEAL